MKLYFLLTDLIVTCWGTALYREYKRDGHCSNDKVPHLLCYLYRAACHMYTPMNCYNYWLIYDLFRRICVLTADSPWLVI